MSFLQDLVAKFRTENPVEPSTKLWSTLQQAWTSSKQWAVDFLRSWLPKSSGGLEAPPSYSAHLDKVYIRTSWRDYVGAVDSGADSSSDSWEESFSYQPESPEFLPTLARSDDVLRSALLEARPSLLPDPDEEFLSVENSLWMAELEDWGPMTQTDIAYIDNLLEGMVSIERTSFSAEETRQALGQRESDYCTYRDHGTQTAHTQPSV